MRKTALAVLSLVLCLTAAAVLHAATPGDANGDGIVSAADGVLILRAARGLATTCDLATCDVDRSGTLTVSDGADVLRNVAGLPATPAASAAPRAGGSSVEVHFSFNASVELQGFQLEVSYPLGKGGFAGSADGVACTSNGDGFFVPNDRDDGTMVLIQANAVALTFPIEIVCRFEQDAGQTLTAADVGVSVVEVVEDGAPGDPEHLLTTVSLATPSVCDTGAVRLTSRTGSVIDAGWTGIFHGSPLPKEGTLTVPLACNPGENPCPIAGDALQGQPAGPLLPLSAGGVPICVLNVVRTTPTGSFDCAEGCSETDLGIQSLVFLNPEVADPCPPCVGDLQPNDGHKDGACSGGATPGAACDVGGVVDRLDTYGLDFGHTSTDCLPANPSVGELDIDLHLTTGTSTLTASQNCLASEYPAGSCHCPGQVAPNSCADGVCSPSGVCEAGPIDGLCSNQPFRACRPGTGAEDCEDIFPGAGSCVDQLRACFPSTIERAGVCGTDDATLTSTFCVPPTRAAAINTVMGLPGPAALTLPVHVAAAPPGEPDACSPTPASNCRSLAPNHESILLLKDHPRSDDELAWRWLGGEATAPEDFGHPDVDTNVAVCIYTPTLALQLRAPAAAVCNGGIPCWHTAPNGGFIYRDPAGNAAGFTRIDLTPGPTGKSRIVVKAHGPSLQLPTLPISAPPIVQVQTSNGHCWEATFSADDVLRNDNKRVRAITRR